MMKSRIPTRLDWSGSGRFHARGFTLIELLVVVGIISILASIATPNFLEAQTRAKTARVKNDARVVAVALESYGVDNTAYPYRTEVAVAGLYGDHMGRCDTKVQEMSVLTTPIAYISTLPIDIFNKREQEPSNILDYWSREITQGMLEDSYTLSLLHATNLNPGFAIVSYGPDGLLGYVGMSYVGCPPIPFGAAGEHTRFKSYDPTNGTVSYGNIFRLQSGGEGSSFYNF